ncbi:MAG: 50S ribosomal protein L6 [Candidatus Muirbacterium halophilum]|nr:50S ribosomal protein L6 [Candidatus Muirbacterium halophilum]MCK9475242.1 50S ribosomal protein L6 [Candidatus Muirbacterium halophilum]
MSRIGKNPIVIPAKVEVKVNGTDVTVKGPKGQVNETFNSEVIIEHNNNEIQVRPFSEIKFHRALHGTVASKIKNMITGVTVGFEKVLKISGVGYKANMKGNDLNLLIGYSNPIDVKVPAGLEAAVEDRGMSVKITGIDKQRVGQFAAEIRALREPEPYKGKGIRYSDEIIIKKAGKRAV